MKSKTLKRKVKRRIKNKNYKRKRREKRNSTRKYVGGSEEDNFPCNNIQTEVHHDLKSVIAKQINKSYLFNRNVTRNNSGICSSPDIFNGQNNFDFFDDGGFVEYITEKNIPQLKEYYEKSEIQIQTRFTGKNDGKRDANAIFKPKPYTRRLFELFKDELAPSDDDGWIDIFFVIDTGDNLVKALKSMIPEENYRIHIIHSVFTLGDSARKTLPNSTSYNCHNSRVQLYSWLFSRYPEINPNDQTFMTSYKIQCSILSQPGFKVYQRWEIDVEGEDGTSRTNVKHETWDSKVDHNNTNVKQEISSRSEYDQANHLSIQKKRSGDHFQIWFAKRFPRYMSARENMDLQYSSHAVPPDFLNSLQEGKSTQYFRDRTYFLTGDWPAFSYSLYNKINTIIFAKHPREQGQTGFLSVSFDR